MSPSFRWNPIIVILENFLLYKYSPVFAASLQCYFSCLSNEISNSMPIIKREKRSVNDFFVCAAFKQNSIFFPPWTYTNIYIFRKSHHSPAYIYYCVPRTHTQTHSHIYVCSHPTYNHIHTQTDGKTKDTEDLCFAFQSDMQLIRPSTGLVRQ